MVASFYERPILNSPYAMPALHHALDSTGQPLDQEPVAGRRRSELITPVPRAKKTSKKSQQKEFNLPDAQGLSTADQEYNPTPIINEIRGYVETWREIPNPKDWGVTPATAQLLQHWRNPESFSSLRPFFCQIEAVETCIWLTEVARTQRRYAHIWTHVRAANAASNPDLLRIALKMATGSGKTTVMAMLIAWQTVNAVRTPNSTLFSRGFLIVTPGITIKDRLRVLLPSDPDSYYRHRELVPMSLLAVGEQPMRLEVTFRRLDFTLLPRVRLLDRAALLPGHRAHIESDDAICYSSPGTLVLDMYQPGRHALTVLRLVRRTLVDILSGEAEADLALEFPQHWRDAYTVHVALPPDAPAGKASVVRLKCLGAVPALVLSRKAPNDDGLDLGAFGAVSGAGSPAFLAVTENALTLGQGESLPTNLAEFLEWAGRVDAALPEGLINGLLAAGEGAMLLVRGSNGCVGAVPSPPESWRPTKQDPGLMARMFRARPERVPVTRVRGSPADAGHVMARNLAGAPSLAGRRITLVGCGTIGGHLAKFLAQSGAGTGGGRLDLVDSEPLMPANLGRHWLQAHWMASSKALACAAEIQATFPSSVVEGHPDDVLLVPEVLAGAELVIDATGEQPLSAALNDRAVLRGDGAALLLVWLRGMGAAAQALLVPAAGDGRGCYRCLRPGLESWSAGDVMAPHATMAEAPASCGEAAFLPYGVAAPAIAAGLAARMALEWAAGTVNPSLRTIRIDLAETVPTDDIDLPANPLCPACSSRA